MTAIRRYKKLFDATTAATTVWHHLDFRYDDSGSVRNLSVNVTAGDSVIVQATAYDVKGTDINNITVPPLEITTLTTITTTGNYAINGPWSAIRITKTGTAGRAVVDGAI